MDVLTSNVWVLIMFIEI